MIDEAERALKLAVRECDQAEVFGERRRSIVVKEEEGRIRARISRAQGIGLRVVIDKRIGFSFTSDLLKIDECVRLAIKQARISERDESFRTLPSEERYPTVEGCYDPKSEGISVKEILEKLECMRNSASGARIVTMSFSCVTGDWIVINSEGINVRDRGTCFSASVSVNADGVSHEEDDASRRFDGVRVEWIVENACEIARESVKQQKIEGGKIAAVFTPKAISSLMSYTTLSHLSAESWQRGFSPYNEGDVIGPEFLEIVDDGTVQGGIGSSKMDGEGVAKRRTVLVDHGILKSFMYDSYHAHKVGRESTGNALRSYDTTPRIGPTNLIVGKCNAKLDELMDGRCLLVTDVIGAHTASRASGEFSVVVHNGFMLEGGRKIPAKDVTICGCMPELWRKAEMIGDDYRSVLFIISPSIRFSQVHVVSS